MKNYKNIFLGISIVFSLAMMPVNSAAFGCMTSATCNDKILVCHGEFDCSAQSEVFVDCDGVIELCETPT